MVRVLWFCSVDSNSGVRGGIGGYLVQAGGQRGFGEVWLNWLEKGG